MQELRNTLESRLGLRLPPTVMFDFPTVSALTTFVCSKLAAQARPAQQQQTHRPATAVAQLPVAAPMAKQMPETAARGPPMVAHIAVANVGCRLPAGARLGRNLSALDTITHIPYSRWDVSAAAVAAGELQASFGSFVHDAAGFDAAAFGLPEAEALLLDPQQRMLMEVAWEVLRSTEALRTAGSAADAAAYRATCGAFVGVSSRDYFTLGKLYSQVWAHGERWCVDVPHQRTCISCAGCFGH